MSCVLNTSASCTQSVSRLGWVAEFLVVCLAQESRLPADSIASVRLKYRPDIANPQSHRHRANRYLSSLRPQLPLVLAHPGRGDNSPHDLQLRNMQPKMPRVVKLKTRSSAQPSFRGRLILLVVKNQIQGLHRNFPPPMPRHQRSLSLDLALQTHSLPALLMRGTISVGRDGARSEFLLRLMTMMTTWAKW
jgi:hypothetical protein